MSQPIAEFEHDGIRILGFSQAGEETYLRFPSSISASISAVPRASCSQWITFFSATAIWTTPPAWPTTFRKRMFIDNAPGNLYLPAGLEDPFRRLLGALG